MHSMPSRISPASLGRLQLRLRRVLRSTGGHYPARQGASSWDAGCYSAIQTESGPGIDHWFAERRHLGTPLSESEFKYGVNAGIIGPTLLMECAQ